MILSSMTRSEFKCYHLIQSETAAFHVTALEVEGQQYGKQYLNLYNL